MLEETKDGNPKVSKTCKYIKTVLGREDKRRKDETDQDKFTKKERNWKIDEQRKKDKTRGSDFLSERS